MYCATLLYMYNIWPSPLLRSNVDVLSFDTEEPETDSDLMLAKMLQMQFDHEFDNQLRLEEKKFNGDSKGNGNMSKHTI